jgi:hypothetical protein
VRALGSRRGGQQQHGGIGFGIAGQVIEIRFLEEDRKFRRVFAAGVSENNDRRVDLGLQFHAPRLVFRGGLGEPRLREKRQERNRQDGCHCSDGQSTKPHGELL